VSRPPRVTDPLLLAAAVRLAEEPLALLTLEDVARDAHVPLDTVLASFGSTVEIGRSILDHERASMRTAMVEVDRQHVTPLQKIVLAFEAVGQNLETDIVIRAGVRIAAESKRFFPERRLDPFETWRAFISRQLALSRQHGGLRSGVDVESTTWLIVSAGMGAKDLIAFQNSWSTAATQMGATARAAVALISGASRPFGGAPG